jgi:hypothetical protein
MADPVTIGLTLLTTGLSMAAQIAQGNQAAAIANANAAAVTDAASSDAAVLARRNKRIQGEARAAIGASGVTVEGSPLLVLADNEREAALQEGEILRRGVNRAKAIKYEGQVQKQQGYVGAGTALLQGVGQVGLNNPFKTLGSGSSSYRLDAAGRILGGV